MTAVAGCFGGNGDEDNNTNGSDNDTNVTDGNESQDGPDSPSGDEGTTPDLTLAFEYNQVSPSTQLDISIPSVRLVVREGEQVDASRIRFGGEKIESAGSTWAELTGNDSVGPGDSVLLSIVDENPNEFQLDVMWLSTEGETVGTIETIAGPARETNAIGPNPSFEFDLDTAAGELTVRLTDGGPIEADQLLFSGADLTTDSVSWSSLIGGEETLTAGDSVTLSLENRFAANVAVVWTSEDRSRLHGLTRHAGPGKPDTSFEFEYDDEAMQLTVQLADGGSIAAEKVRFDGVDLDQSGQTWASLANTNSSVINEGDSITLDTQSGAYSVRTLWVPSEREPRELTTTTGPVYVEPPESSFDFTYDTTTGEVTMELADGDSFSAERVTLQGTLVGDERTWGDIIDDDRTVEVGDSATFTPESPAYSLELLWTNVPGTQTKTLATTEGPDAPPEAVFFYGHRPDAGELDIVPTQNTETFDASQVTLEGENFNEIGTTWAKQTDMTGDETTAGPGDGLTLTGVGEETTVELAWESEDGKRSTVLETYTIGEGRVEGSS